MNLNELLTQYRDMYVELQPAIDQMNALKNQISEHVKETGETGDVDGVKVSIRKGSSRRTWDSKALAGYATAHPEIEKFSSVKISAPAVTIKVE
jgi:hypothetical protein